ncbi:MAG: fatty acyl-AMP ligase [Ktedonobacteraceae bacterium]
MAVDLSYPAVKTLTFVDILTQRAIQQPEQIAYTFLHFGKEADTSVTYGELDRQARTIAIQLQHLGYEGKVALLLYPSGLEYIAAFLGCLYAGTIAVPVYPPHTARLLPRIQSIIKDAQTDLVLTTAETQANISHKFMHIPELRQLHWITTDMLPSVGERRWQRPELAGDQLAFLQYTSGSTSMPKGVMVSHGNLFHNSETLKTQWGLSEKDQGVSWLPMFHDLGLILGILQPLYTGYHTVLMAPTAFLQHPLRWLQALSAYKATITAAPNFAYELCLHKTSPADRAKLDLSHWQLAINGAEPVRSETLKQFSATFASCGFQSNTFRPSYGLAEATLLVTSAPRHAAHLVKHINKTLLEQHIAMNLSPDDQHAQAMVGCGKTVLGQYVIAVHPETCTRCLSEEIGEIWITGESVAKGYFGKEEETENTFHAHLVDTDEGSFLRTGDLGFVRNGEVFITGRLKDLILIKGRNHYPQDLEYTVEQSSPIIRPGCTIAFSVDLAQEERLVIVAEIRLPQSGLAPSEVTQRIDEAVKAIRRNIAATHEIAVYQIKLVDVGAVPKTSSGKLQRRACRATFLAGELKEWNR